ncbi:hypothetical protein D3C73_1655980 [compost metagenome]
MLHVEVNVAEPLGSRRLNHVVQQSVLHLLIIKNDLPQLRAELAVLQIGDDHHQNRAILTGDLS